MQALVAFILTALLPIAATQTAPERLCYVGKVKLSAGDGKPLGSEVILLEKLHDPSKSSITERAIVVKPDGKAEEQTMVLTVKADHTFSLVDTARTVEGTGTLFGPAWRWTYFKGTFRHQERRRHRGRELYAR